VASSLLWQGVVVIVNVARGWCGGHRRGERLAWASCWWWLTEQAAGVVVVYVAWVLMGSVMWHGTRRRRGLLTVGVDELAVSKTNEAGVTASFVRRIPLLLHRPRQAHSFLPLLAFVVLHPHPHRLGVGWAVMWRVAAGLGG
jgi:hypothetical protein